MNSEANDTQEQVKADAMAFAELIYDIYIEKNTREIQSEQTEDNQ